MNSWRARTTATTLLISVRPRTASPTDYGRRGEKRGEDFARKNKNVGVQRDPSESEVWSVGCEGREGDKKSSLLFHDGFSVGIRNPGMKGERESEWIVDCLR